MEKRQQQLTSLKAYTNSIEKEVTLLLQNFQWDPKLTREKPAMVTCRFNSNHRIPLNVKDLHEEQCHLTKLGYTKGDIFLPDPVDAGANTLVKFSKNEIAEIIKNAAIHDPLLKRGVGSQESEPLTVERLQRVYSADERRAIYDAVVNTAPFCHDLTVIDLLSSNDEAKSSQKKSRLEILSELRDMKRRRAKYRVAPKTRNYSHVLRDVIKTQMDSYGETTRTIIKTEYGQNVNVSQQVSNIGPKKVSHGEVDELEIEPPENIDRNQRDRYWERHRAKSRENKYDDRRVYQRDKYPSKERDRSYDKRQSKISRDYTENSRGKRDDERENSSARNKYTSRERTENCDDYQRKESSDRSRDKRCNDSRSSYYSDNSTRDRSRNYESQKTYTTVHDIKQERASQESESSAQYNRDRNGDSSNSNERRHHDSKTKHYGEERSAKRQKRCSAHIVIKEERTSYNNSESSKKRDRSRSKERRHKDKKRRHDKEKHSSKRDQNYDSGNRQHASEMLIKQERKSS